MRKQHETFCGNTFVNLDATNKFVQKLRIDSIRNRKPQGFYKN